MIRAVLFLLLLVPLVSCDDGEVKVNHHSYEDRQPGPSELNKQITWLEIELANLAPLLEEANPSEREQKEIMRKLRLNLESYDEELRLADPLAKSFTASIGSNGKITIFERGSFTPCIPSKGIVPEPSLNDFIRYASGLDLPENQVTFYYTQHREALERQRYLRAQGIGARHPDMLALKKQATENLENARREAQSVMKLLALKQAARDSAIAKIRRLVVSSENDHLNFQILKNKALDLEKSYREALARLEELKKE